MFFEQSFYRFTELPVFSAFEIDELLPFLRVAALKSGRENFATTLFGEF